MKIYWAKGLYFNGRLTKLNWTLNEMFLNLNGFGNFSKFNFIRRFELTYHHYNKFLKYPKPFVTKVRILNSYFSYATNTNHGIDELLRYTLIRLYLIKSFRGRAQALGKPSRGQRTWSNAWNAHKLNTIIRKFINQVNKNRRNKKKPKKINYKLLARKFAKPVFKLNQQKVKKTYNVWY